MTEEGNFGMQHITIACCHAIHSLAKPFFNPRTKQGWKGFDITMHFFPANHV